MCFLDTLYASKKHIKKDSLPRAKRGGGRHGMAAGEGAMILFGNLYFYESLISLERSVWL